MDRKRYLNGYVLIYMPEHSRSMSSENWNGFVYEHIVIAEESIGRRLKKEEVVHHLDENRSNNHSKNLLVLETGQHNKLHAWLRRSRGEANRKQKKCLICSAWFYGRSERKYCSQECSQFSSRKVEWPTKEQLEEDIRNMSWCAIGRKYGVSDNGARNWAKNYGIELKTRKRNKEQ